MSIARASSATSVFGRRMRQARVLLGLPQDKLGVLIGIDEGSSSARMSRYENGVHEPPIQVATLIAKALGVPLAFMYCDDDDLAELILAYKDLGARDRKQLKQWISERRGV